jgi:hypothetical protein
MHSGGVDFLSFIDSSVSLAPSRHHLSPSELLLVMEEALYLFPPGPDSAPASTLLFLGTGESPLSPFHCYLFSLPAQKF